MDFSVYQAPNLWTSLCSWLKPPYLYVILNCIIITIAAASRFHHSHGDDKDQPQQLEHEQEQIPAPKITDEPDLQFHYDMKISAAAAPEEGILSDYGGLGLELTVAQPEAVYEKREIEEAVIASVFEDKRTVFVAENSVKKEDEYDFTISQATWFPSKRIRSSENLPELLLAAEKPLVSTRFGHRKPVKASPEGGRSLRVAKPKRQETLENTWKMITEGRAMPLTRHLKKSDTFDYGRPMNTSELDPHHVPKKSETFKDRTNYQAPHVNNGYSSSATSGTDGKLRKEPSLSQDDLNRRVEAFINKFNEEMRMQRQESLNQYKEMISLGSQ